MKKQESLVTLLKAPFYKEFELDKEKELQRYTPITKDQQDKFFNYLTDNTIVVPRHLADGDANYSMFKQLIPYTVIVNKETEEVFVTERLTGSGEERLWGQVSVGVGGHANPSLDYEAEDVQLEDGVDIYFENVTREIEEETTLNMKSINNGAIALGFINDDTPNGVGSVHFGVLNILEVGATLDKIKSNEPDKLLGKVLNINELKTVENLETWTQIIIPEIEKYFAGEIKNDQ